MATGTIIPQGYSTVEDSNGNAVAGALVWTYAAGTTTPQATYTTEALSVANSNPIVADGAGRFVVYAAQGTSYKLVYENPATPPTHGSVIITVDNVIAGASVSQSASVTGTAGEALALGKVVYLSDGQGAKTAGRWYAASSSQGYSSNGVPIGLVSTAAVAAGNAVTVTQTGLSTDVAGLTPGTVYYLNSSGGLTTFALTTTGTRRVIGTAQTATSIVLGTPGEQVATTKVLDQAVNVTVSSTVTPTAVYTYAVPAGTVGIARALRLTLVGEYGNTSGSPSDLTVAIVFGGQTIATGVIATYATGSAGPVAFDVWIAEVGVNFQKAQAMFSYSKSATTTWGAQTLGLGAMNGSMTVDVSSAQTLSVTVTHSVSNALTFFTMYTTTLELVGQ